MGLDFELDAPVVDFDVGNDDNNINNDFLRFGDDRSGRRDAGWRDSDGEWRGDRRDSSYGWRRDEIDDFSGEKERRDRGHFGGLLVGAAMGAAAMALKNKHSKQKQQQQVLQQHEVPVSAAYPRQQQLLQTPGFYDVQQQQGMHMCSVKQPPVQPGSYAMPPQQQLYGGYPLQQQQQQRQGVTAPPHPLPTPQQQMQTPQMQPPYHQEQFQLQGAYPPQQYQTMYSPQAQQVHQHMQQPMFAAQQQEGAYPRQQPPPLPPRPVPSPPQPQPQREEAQQNGHGHHHGRGVRGFIRHMKDHF